ncbi:interferon lambda receptor 1 [Betta splendens]|uniref:Interferon lambda receptor 1 n=1 Tax=Betta splendens TaxID=158456 RepID=A0A6P7KWZ2_BETSP|nr:interferon lambda receptor 1 [Betta splendens]
MEMWSINVITLLLFCYARPLTGKVYFVSKNFNNTLHWDPPESASPQEKVLYSVQYKSDDMDRFQIKKECQDITALSCDLTAETASIYDIQYEAQVFINDTRYGKTTRFKPLAETAFGPPGLTVEATASSLVVNVVLPPGPDGASIANIINRSTGGHSKNIIIYTLNIIKPQKAEVVKTNTNPQFVIDLKENEAEYCGHVVYNTLSEWGRSQSQKASFCHSVKPPGDYSKLLPWLLVGAGLLAVIMLVLVLCMWNYAKGGKQPRMPHLLVENLHTPQNVLPNPFEVLKTVTVYTTSTVNGTNPVEPRVLPVGPVDPKGYCPQDPIFQDSSGSSVDTAEHTPTPTPQDTTAQSDYGAVVVQHVNPPQPDADHPSNSRPQLFFSRGTVPSPDPDATEGDAAEPLMLHIERTPDGQLVLSSLFSPMRGRGGDDAAPLPADKEPLLSDPIDVRVEAPSRASLQSFDSSEWSDSGCDDSNANTPTHCSPSQVIFESGYKQNWMPRILLGDVGDGSFSHQRNFP